jgi:quinol monooxygenase YgiN
MRTSVATGDLLRSCLRPSRAEPGSLHYDLWADEAEPHRFMLDERYENADAIAAPGASGHFQTYLAAIDHLAERSAFMLRPLGVA